MSRLRRLALVAVAAAIGVFSGNRNFRPIARIDPSQEPIEFADSTHDLIVPAEPLGADAGENG
jgi:hypothetical protein